MASVAKQIREVEGFKVRFPGAKPSKYQFARAASGRLTVSQWREKRIAENTDDVIVINKAGFEVHGRTLLQTVRDSYL